MRPTHGNQLDGLGAMAAGFVTGGLCLLNGYLLQRWARGDRTAAAAVVGMAASTKGADA